MKKKSAKKRDLTPEYDSKREHNVILEKIYSEISTLGEGQSSLSDRIDGIDKIVRKLESKSFGLEMNVQGIKSNVGTVDIKADRIERELETVKTATMENSQGIKELKQGQTEIKDSISAYERRLEKLEAVR